MTSSKKKDVKDIVIEFLVIALTLGLGIMCIFLHFYTDNTRPLEKLVWLIIGAALLPAGLLWTIQHYFLLRPLEEKQKKTWEQLHKRVEELEIVESVRAHGFRSISTERGNIVRAVLESTLDDPTSKEIIIIGSTLDGLIRRAKWFETFVDKALKLNKEFKLMFTHWDYVSHRERQEDRPNGAISQELKRSLAKILQWGVTKENIKLAYGAPTVFMVIAGNNMILNPYPFGGESVTSAAIWLEKPGTTPPKGEEGSIWREYYINHYDKPWNPDKPEYQRKSNRQRTPLSYPLPDDWETKIDNFINKMLQDACDNASDTLMAEQGH